jgi:acyl carrier protein
VKEDVNIAVRRFVAETFLSRSDGSAISDDASLSEAGVVFDANAMLELVCFLEITLGIRVDEEIPPERVASIRAITDYVMRTLSPADGATADPVARRAAPRRKRASFVGSRNSKRLALAGAQ